MGAKTSKVVFLDVDGVLNSRESIQRDGPHSMDSGMLNNLKTLIDQTGATIIISSTWRLDSDNHAELLEKLSDFGLKSHGVTPDLEGQFLGDRTMEISSWLKQNNVTNWVALDDLPLHRLDENLMDGHFVHTNPHLGFTKEDLEKAIQILNS